MRLDHRVEEILRRCSYGVEFEIIPQHTTGKVSGYQTLFSGIPSLSLEDVALVQHGELIPQWAESQGECWGRLDRINTEPQRVIALCGQRGPPALSDAGRTFDNFIDPSTTDGWTAPNGGLSSDGSELRIYDNSSGTNVYATRSISHVRDNFTAEVTYRFLEVAGDNVVAFGIGDSSDGDRFCEMFAYENSAYHMSYRVGATTYKLYDTYTYNTIYKWKVNVRKSAGKIDYYLYNSANTLLASALDKGYGYPAGGSPVAADKISISGGGTASVGDGRFSVLRTRAYASPEPIVRQVRTLSRSQLETAVRQNC